MYKTFLSLVMLFAFCTLNAQNNMPSKEEMQRKVQQLQMRDASKLHLQQNYPLSATPMTCTATENEGLQLPDGSWFPGEWEEVQAIVVT